MKNDKQQMSKGAGTFKVILLFGVVLLLSLYGFLKVQVNGSVNSQFNQTTRFKLGRYEFSRWLFGLNNYGDARATYLVGNAPIILQYAYAEGQEISDYLVRQFADKIQNITARNVQILLNGSFKSGKLSNEDLEKIAKNLKRTDISGQPELLVLFAEDFSREEGEVGKTFQEFGIVLSVSKLKEVTEQLPQSLPEYIGSSLLHEFGHQIGLEHNSENNCIMNQKVESPDIFPNQLGEYTMNNFCDFELEQIKQIKSKL